MWRAIWHKLSAGMRFALVCVLLFVIALPFRMPPLSKSKSRDFYKIGSEAGQSLEAVPSRVDARLENQGKVLTVSAPVRVPDNRHVRIYSAQSVPVNREQLLDAFFPKVESFAVNSSVESDTRLCYDIAFDEISSSQGYVEITENGRLQCYFGDISARIKDARQAAQWLSGAGLSVREAQVQYYPSERVYVVRPLVDGIPISYLPTVDTRGVNSRGGACVLVTEGERPVDLYGMSYQPDEVLLEDGSVISPEQALEAVRLHMITDVQICEIILAYHPWPELADPFRAILYPVWEMRTADSPYSEIVINAITGEVERFAVPDEEGADA